MRSKDTKDKVNPYLEAKFLFSYFSLIKFQVNLSQHNKLKNSYGIQKFDFLKKKHEFLCLEPTLQIKSEQEFKIQNKHRDQKFGSTGVKLFHEVFKGSLSSKIQMKYVAQTNSSNLLKPSNSSHSKTRMIVCMRLLKCFVLQNSLIKAIRLRSLIQGVVEGFE